MSVAGRETSRCLPCSWALWLGATPVWSLPESGEQRRASWGSPSPCPPLPFAALSSPHEAHPAQRCSRCESAPSSKHILPDWAEQSPGVLLLPLGTGFRISQVAQDLP